MKSSETYINSQAPPKVAFVPNRSDFSFLLHMHMFQRLRHCHMFPKTGTRKQPVPPQGKFPILSYAISSGVPSQTRHQHFCAQPTSPWGLTGNLIKPATEKLLRGTVKGTVSQPWGDDNCSLCWWARITRKTSPPLLSHFPPSELKWKTHLIVC